MTWKADVIASTLIAMDDTSLTFSEWISFEAERIVRMGLAAPVEHRADYMRVQIEAALRKASDHFRDGLTDEDPPRSTW